MMIGIAALSEIKKLFRVTINSYNILLKSLFFKGFFKSFHQKNVKRETPPEKSCGKVSLLL